MASWSSEMSSSNSPPGTIFLSTLVLFLTSLLAISPLLIADAAAVVLAGEAPPLLLQAAVRTSLDLLARRHRLTILLHLLRAFSGDDLHGPDDDDEEEEEAKMMARGHRAPPPRAVAMAMSTDDLMARFLSWRLAMHMALFPPEDEME